MSALHAALDAISAILESHRPLDETVELLERALERAMGAEAVAIRLGDAAAGDRRSASIVPLLLDGMRIGTLFVRFALGADARSDETRLLAAPLAAALAWRAHNDERVRLNDLVRTDALTRLANRLAFDEWLDAAWRRCNERSAPLTLVLLDIDYFKTYNDIYGHVAGDECLRRVAAMLRSHARPYTGLVARYGGEEFAMISETLVPGDALRTIDALLQTFAARPIPHAGSTLGCISLSAGIASFVPRDLPIADFVREADRCLYRAKVLGRNRVCAGGEASERPAVTRQARALLAPRPFEDETVGREADVARAMAALRQSRMLTLVGPAGIGKSRLARLIGTKAQQTLTDGVAYIDLAILTAAADPVVTLAAALEVETDARDVLETVRDALRERVALVIFDHADAIDARRVATRCDQLLAAIESLSIVATSRSALGCRDERVVVVAPLAEEAALELLRVRSGLRPGADARRLRDIVRTVGGSPRALELAARGTARPA